jgi:hypothetical protein
VADPVDEVAAQAAGVDADQRWRHGVSQRLDDEVGLAVQRGTASPCSRG